VSGLALVPCGLVNITNWMPLFNGMIDKVLASIIPAILNVFLTSIQAAGTFAADLLLLSKLVQKFLEDFLHTPFHLITKQFSGICFHKITVFWHLVIRKRHQYIVKTDHASLGFGSIQSFSKTIRSS